MHNTVRMNKNQTETGQDMNYHDNDYKDGIFINTEKPVRWRIKAAVFDFDGTISTLRCGWEGVMRKMMLSVLPPDPAGETEKAVDAYIDESTGVQTIYQMEWLSDMVAAKKGIPRPDPWEYKDMYNDMLMKTVNERKKRLSDSEKRAGDYLVPGSLWFLRYLKERGVDIYVASGTDDSDLQKEVGLLGISPYICLAKGSPDRQKGCSKEQVIRQILTSEKIVGGEMLVAGDGRVEIALGRETGAVTLGVASDEKSFSGRYNMKKFQKLKGAGADYIVPDFEAIRAVTKSHDRN